MSEELDKKIDSIDEIKDSLWAIARDAGVDPKGCSFYFDAPLSIESIFLAYFGFKHILSFPTLV